MVEFRPYCYSYRFGKHKETPICTTGYRMCWHGWGNTSQPRSVNLSILNGHMSSCSNSLQSSVTSVNAPCVIYLLKHPSALWPCQHLLCVWMVYFSCSWESSTGQTFRKDAAKFCLHTVQLIKRKRKTCWRCVHVCMCCVLYWTFRIISLNHLFSCHEEFIVLFLSSLLLSSRHNIG